MNDLKIKRLKQVITLLALIVALIHLLFPKVAIDGITLGLIVLAILPWLSPIIKSLELPGGFKVELQELQKATDRADSVGLLSKTQGVTDSSLRYSFQTLAESDPNLALAGLRIEIEKRLSKLAELKGLDVGRKGVGILLRNLADKQIISASEQSVLADMVGLLNSAVHGAKVDSNTADWAINIGPRLLSALDARISETKD